jgi:hypothetical protein
MVLFARVTDAQTGVIHPTAQNPATAQGVICNYDASQYGENPTDRRQGQFQINIVGAGFATRTLAVAEVTFEPGRAYRMVFKGQGPNYVAQAYDLHDLTTPLVTLAATDTENSRTNGACGILAFSRQGTAGTADSTYDNYYAGTTNPNLAAAPALSHPVPGIPVVDTRVPSQRWKNFHDPAQGIAFTAKTYTADVIDAGATKLRLNGVDVSSRLILSANGSSINGSLPGTALDVNRTYSAELVVTDVTGTKSSTNTFWFDTYSDAYLRGSNVKTIEVEDYNYAVNDVAGFYVLDPVPVSGLDTNGSPIGRNEGYFELGGYAGIDFSNRNAFADGNPNLAAYRFLDAVRTINGGFLGIRDDSNVNEYAPGTDNVRSQFGAAGLLEYVVGRTEPTEWLNYTREFAPALYAAYLRCSSFGATTNELHLVTSDPTQTNQTTVKLGDFLIPNNQRWVNYTYVPLQGADGLQPLLNLSATNTLRLVIAGVAGQDNRKTMLNYIMMVKTPVGLVSADTVDGVYAPEPGATVNVNNRTITVPAAGLAKYYRIASPVAVKIQKIQTSGGVVTVSF